MALLISFCKQKYTTFKWKFIYRMILKKLEKLKRVEVPQEQPGFVRILKELRHVTVNDEGTAVFEMHMENLSPDKHLV